MLMGRATKRCQCSQDLRKFLSTKPLRYLRSFSLFQLFTLELHCFFKSGRFQSSVYLASKSGTSFESVRFSERRFSLLGANFCQYLVLGELINGIPISNLSVIPIVTRFPSVFSSVNRLPCR